MTIRPHSMLFPADVLPDTRFMAPARAHALALALCAALIATAVVTMGLALIVAAAVGVWWFSRPENLRFLTEFEREHNYHWGLEAPESAVLPLQPRWLYGAIIVCGLVPVLGGVTAIILIIHVFRQHVAQTGENPLQACRSHLESVFTYLAYPDHRYRSPGDENACATAIWRPHDSMWRRRWNVSLFLAPLYSATAAQVLMSSAVTGGWGVVPSLLFLLVPALTLAAMSVAPLHALRRQYFDHGLGSMSEWQAAVYRVRGSNVTINGKRLNEHVFVGYVLPTREQAVHPYHSVDRFDLPCRVPALIPISAFSGHAHISGPAGSGKSTNGLLGILLQVI